MSNTVSSTRRTRTVLTLVVLAMACCLLAAAAGLAYLFLTPTAEARPVVVIQSPEHGAEVMAGETVVVHAIATDDTKVTRFELWIDGALYHAESSSIPGGASPYPLVVYWPDPSAGSHTITARAFNGNGDRSHASVTIEAIAMADRDGDEVPDGIDTCPDEAGSRRAEGCPDRDGDGIPDAEDACADETGLPAGDGCPVPSDGDRDGDGTMDEADACPDEPGPPRAEGCPDRDGDGIPDAEDACPDDRGVPEEGGCPSGGEDRDGDGIPDDEDACPDEAGPPVSEGCPDRDADGTIDAEDACPDEPGPPDSPAGAGCPVPGDGDRDGDGIPDADDACPDEPGSFWAEGCPDRDGDTVRDSEDACPDEPGPPDNDGCPLPAGGEDDGDGDGIPDALDDCPDEWGVPEHDGCPDTDGDGVPDHEDLCPEDPGLPELLGCPDTGAGDRDGDGIPDDVDPCPDEAGLPEHDGCPPPGEGGDDDGDGIPDDEEPMEGPFDDIEPLWPDDEAIDIMLSAEFQALSFSVNDDYDGVYCYGSLAGEPEERYSFDPLGERSWDIAADLGSVHLGVPSSEPLHVSIECAADVVFMDPGEGGGWGVYYDLGSFEAEHSQSDWDGHVIRVSSSGGDEGRAFNAEYRICAGTCEDADFPPPILTLYHYSGDAQLLWLWEGDRENIDGFHVYIDGSRAFSLPPDAFAQSVLAYEPSCGGRVRREFHMTAFSGDRESPPSNLAYWTSRDCPRLVQVTFDAFTTFHLGDDEWWAEGSVGPIYGNFWATGSNSESLDFFAVDYGDWWGERDRGYRIRSTRYYPVQNVFDWIQRELAECPWSTCPAYYGPENNFVTIELDPYENLVFGGLIRDVDSNNPDDTLFDGQEELRPDQVVPSRHRIWDRNIELAVLVDVLVGPAAGEHPDLTITDVTGHEDSGQLRIHVFNNAADLTDTDIAFHIVQMSTNESIAHPVFENVSIPSGGERTLSLSEPLIEPRDLRVILDPDNDIVEMNDGNNIYETPVVMRVEFIEVGSGNCNENGCSIFDCDSEHFFQVYAGYGPSSGEVTWVGYNVRFPRSGELIACSHPICRDNASPDEDWMMEGDERYTFEFEMPADQRLYVMVTGEERDHTNLNDSLGVVRAEYVREMDYGVGFQSGQYGEETICDDTFCIPCPRGLWATWRITRVR
jgi:hypothetical protein